MRKKQLSKRQIIQELQEEVRLYKASYREADGKVKDRGALQTIAALKAAIKIVASS